MKYKQKIVVRNIVAEQNIYVVKVELGIGVTYWISPKRMHNDDSIINAHEYKEILSRAYRTKEKAEADVKSEFSMLYPRYTIFEVITVEEMMTLEKSNISSEIVRDIR